MPRVWVSVGSNIDPEAHIRNGLAELRDLFGHLTLSPLYETAPVGIGGDTFLNLVVGFHSDQTPGELRTLMREIEARQGRERNGDPSTSRTLDLDVLTYGDLVTDEGGNSLPRDEILLYGFVLAPLADVAGHERHPVLGETYAELWSRLTALQKQGLRRVDTPTWLTPGRAQSLP